MNNKAQGMNLTIVTIAALVVIVLLLIGGFMSRPKGPVPLGYGSGAMAVAEAKNLRTDLFLLPGFIGGGSEVNDTRYVLWLVKQNGRSTYLGDWAANRTLVLNTSRVNASTLKGENVSLVPGDKLLFLAYSKNGTVDDYTVYATQGTYEVPDRAVDYISPRLDAVRDHFARIIVSERGSFEPLDERNWTLKAYDYSTVTLDVDLVSNERFDYFCCKSSWTVRLNSASPPSLEGGGFLQKDLLQYPVDCDADAYRLPPFNDLLRMNLPLEIKNIDNSTEIACQFFDMRPIIATDNSGPVLKYDAMDYAGKDLGAPNPGFKIKIEGRGP